MPADDAQLNTQQYYVECIWVGRPLWALFFRPCWEGGYPAALRLAANVAHPSVTTAAYPGPTRLSWDTARSQATLAVKLAR